MHELGVLSEVIRTITELADAQNIEKVDSVVLEVGELCGMVPMYIENCYPAVTFNKPRFVDSTLEIVVVPGEAKCQDCGEVFNVVKHEGYCPKCKSFEKDVISGLEFMIKEIRVLDEDYVEEVPE